MLRDGILSYGKSKSDITKNKLHGTVNTFFSIVSYITSSRRILIDFSTQSNAFVCHLKVFFYKIIFKTKNVYIIRTDQIFELGLVRVLETDKHSAILKQITKNKNRLRLKMILKLGLSIWSTIAVFISTSSRSQQIMHLNREFPDRVAYQFRIIQLKIVQ